VGNGVGVSCREGEAAAAEAANRSNPRAIIMNTNGNRRLVIIYAFA
jgi:hypothetical protein